MKALTSLLLLIVASFSVRLSAQGAVNLTAPVPNAVVSDIATAFSWEHPGGTVAKFKLRVQTLNRSFVYARVLTPIEAACSAGETCSITPSDLVLPNLSTLRWRVIARSPAGKQVSVWNRFTTSIPKPGTPTLIGPEENLTFSLSQPDFTWLNGGQTKRFQLVVRDGAGKLVHKAKIPALNCSDDVCTAAMTDTELTDVGLHTWFVKAKSAYGITKSAVAHFYYVPQYAADMLELVNQKRCEADLVPLVLNDALSAAAMRHAIDMSVHNFYDHVGSDGRTYRQRIRLAGYTGKKLGENIHSGTDNAITAFETWWTFIPARVNILDPEFREMGIAYTDRETSQYQQYWVQTFGARDTTPLAVCP